MASPNTSNFYLEFKLCYKKSYQIDEYFQIEYRNSMKTAKTTAILFWIVDLL
jgi:hypothetical protein